MRIIPTAAISLLLITQTACLQTANFATIEPQVEKWNKNQEYGRSLDTLARINPDDPDYLMAASLLRQVEKQAANLEQQTLKNTQAKQDQGDWASALTLYDEALARHPRSSVIKDGLARLNLQQQSELNHLERKRLILHGEWLRDILPIHIDIARIDPRNYYAQRRLDNVIREAQQVSSDLALLGNKALADSDLSVAEETLPLAAILYDAPDIRDSLKTLRKQQKLEKNKRQEISLLKQKNVKDKREAKKRQRQNLEKKYNKAFTNRNYNAARKHVSNIEKLDPGYAKLPAMKAQLKSAIDSQVSKLFEAGVSAYSRGEYELAAKSWRATLKLVPNHKLAKKNLQRTEKVLKKLEKLKLKQSS